MAKNELYAFYDPSLPAAVIAMALYLFSTVFALWQAFHNKTPVVFFLLVGSALEAVAFIGRTYSITHEQDMWGFIFAYALPIVAPPFIAASLYQILGRIVWATTPLDRLNARHLWIQPRFVAPAFCLFELFSLLIQIVGAIIVGSALNSSSSGSVDGAQALDPTILQEQKVRNGTKVTEVGVILHLVCTGLFVLFAMRFTLLSRSYKPNIRDNWTRLLWAVTGASMFLTVQAIFRSFEFVQSPFIAHLVTVHEWFFYVLDCAPVLLALLLMHAFHPGKHLPHHFLGFHLDHKVAMQLRREEAANSQSHSMYVDPERGHVDGIREEFKAPPPDYEECCDKKDSSTSKDSKDAEERFDDDAVEVGKISK